MMGKTKPADRVEARVLWRGAEGLSQVAERMLWGDLIYENPACVKKRLCA